MILRVLSVAFAALCVLVLLLGLAAEIWQHAAQASDPIRVICENLGTMWQPFNRCETREAICYVAQANGVSMECKWK